MRQPPREDGSPAWPTKPADPASSALRRTAVGILHGFLILLGVASAAALVGRISFCEIATHLRPHYALAASICALVLAAFRSRWGSAVALVLTAINGAPVLSYLLASPPPRQTNSHAVPVKLMSVNINFGNSCHECVLETIRDADADVVVLLEVTPALWRDFVVLDATYPYRTARPGTGGGIGILSRRRLVESEILDLDDSGQPALRATLDVEGTPLWILALHPPPPMDRTWAWYRDRQLARASTLARDAQGAKVIVGDLNVTPWSPYYKTLLRNSGLRDARRGFGLWPTWPTWLPASLGIPIDHCLVDGVDVLDFRTGAATGSDHRPIVIDLSVNGPE
jgi:endonuclease/exonuclease/phosphatase (EEP) superfamily protein YafD